MKRILPIVFIGAFVLALATSCGTSRANCDAYGDLNKVEQSDLANQ